MLYSGIPAETLKGLIHLVDDSSKLDEIKQPDQTKFPFIDS